MSNYRSRLPQVLGDILLTDGGLETTLIFHDGIDLPDFAAFPLVNSDAGRDTLRRYYRSYADIARRLDVGIVLETPTWRASADWGTRLGYGPAELAAANAAAVDLLREIRAEYEPATTVVFSGNLGPRGDGYDVGTKMTVAEAEAYHHPQIATFASAGADLVTVLTMNYVEEAIGLVRAAVAEVMPVVVSFTVETDGNLPSGQPLGAAIEAVEEATDGYPPQYGINCAHPDHLERVLAEGGDWRERVGLLRANASRMSHEELDNSEELDAGDPAELGQQYADLRRQLPNLVVLGGCCGTDDLHVAAIGAACLATA